MVKMRLELLISMEVLTILLIKLGLLRNIMDKQPILFIMKVMLLQILQLFQDFGVLIKEDKMANSEFNTNDSKTWIVYYFIIHKNFNVIL
jgi:hypothetical protein